MQDSDEAVERKRKLSSEANIATVLVLGQEKLIEDLLSQKVQLLGQISLLREQLTRYEELVFFSPFVAEKTLVFKAMKKYTQSLIKLIAGLRKL
jgi:hypothetical protein